MTVSRLTLLNGRSAAATLAKHGLTMLRDTGDRIDDFVAGFYALPRGSVFVAAENVPEPFAFAATVAGQRTYIVVAREYGDLAWPAWLNTQRIRAAGDAVRMVRHGMADVLDAIDASKERVWRARHGIIAGTITADRLVPGGIDCGKIVMDSVGGTSWTG